MIITSVMIGAIEASAFVLCKGFMASGLCAKCRFRVWCSWWLLGFRACWLLLVGFLVAVFRLYIVSVGHTASVSMLATSFRAFAVYLCALVCANFRFHVPRSYMHVRCSQQCHYSIV